MNTSTKESLKTYGKVIDATHKAITSILDVGVAFISELGLDGTEDEETEDTPELEVHQVSDGNAEEAEFEEADDE